MKILLVITLLLGGCILVFADDSYSQKIKQDDKRYLEDLKNLELITTAQSQLLAKMNALSKDETLTFSEKATRKSALKETFLKIKKANTYYTAVLNHDMAVQKFDASEQTSAAASNIPPLPTTPAPPIPDLSVSPSVTSPH